MRRARPRGGASRSEGSAGGSMQQSEIAKALEAAGFILQPKTGIAIDAGTQTLRYAGGRIRGSFYVANCQVPGDC
jgi:hypothetical protein